MKTFVLHACALLSLSLSATAEIIGVETFDYADGNVASENGGMFWDYKNTAPAGRSGTASTWDVLANTPTFNAGQLVTSGNAVAKREYNGSNESDGAISDANVAKTVYYRVNVTTGSSVAEVDYFGISSVNAGTEVFYFGKRGVSPNWAVEQVGVGGTNGSLAVLPNQTYTLVAQVDLPGNAIRLYVNPDLNSAQSAPFNANTALVASQAYNGNAPSTAVRFAAGTAVRWDNLVVATTWEELRLTIVTTLDDEDDGPTSLTNPADISLREAVKYSPSDSLITFAASLSGQTITLTHADGDMVIDHAFTLTIDATALPCGITLDGNRVSQHLYVDSGESLTLRGLTITRSQLSAVKVSGTLNAENCTFVENISSAGGAIATSRNGSMRLRHCTFTGNAALYGGAIWFFGDSHSTLTHCTFTGNHATYGRAGGAIDLSLGSLSMTGCILAGNYVASGIGPDFWKSYSATLTSATNCLIGDGTGSMLTNGVDGNLLGTTAAPIDAKLSPLGYFGGPVQTMHPLIGSPAIDAAGSIDPGGTDVRGFPRFVDGDANASTALDIGAVEAGPLRTVAFSSDAGSSGALRGRIGLSTEPGARLGFLAANFPAQSITLNGTQIDIPATANGLFIDASNLTGPVTVSGNNASRVFNIASGATVAMHSVRIVNGKAADGGLGSAGENGGGILNAGSLSLFSCTLSGHATGSGGDGDEDLGSSGGSGGNGGGIFSSGSLSLTACTLSGNATGNGGSSTANGGFGGNGGGIFSSGSLSLTACTLSGNRAGNGGLGSDGGSGGGIFSAGSLSLTACTLTGNAAGTNGDFGSGDGFGGGLSGGSVLLENCLIGLNTRGGGTPDDVNVTSITYVGGNQLGTAATVTGAATGAPTFVETPSILALGDYGGPTQTVALQPSSRARNAGTATARSTDQRGFPIVGAPDLGAFEVQGSTVTLTSSANPSASGTSVTFTATVNELDPQAITPTGSVIFTVDGTPGSPVVLNASGSATLTTSALTAGTRTITATYDGDARLLPSTSRTLNQTVLDLTVGNGNDSGNGSLRQALANAAAHPGPDTIKLPIGLHGQTLTLLTQLLINDAGGVTIDASGLSNGFTISGGGNVRLFTVATGSTVILKNLTLINGAGVGGSLNGAGGAIYNNAGATLSLDGCTLSGHSTNVGGAIWNNGGVLALTRCAFTGNAATDKGGAVNSTGGLTAQGCTFSGNTATSSGGALYTGGTASLTNCTFTANAGQSGGGVFNQSGGVLALTHCTLTLNSATVSGGGIGNSYGAVTLANCIVAQNTAPSGADISNSGSTPFGSATVTRVGVNIVRSYLNNGNTATDSGPTALNADPLLNVLGNYGGPTPTMPLLPGSPALDQASVLKPALTTDQRGLPRPLGVRPDIGAVEGTVIIVTTSVDELDAPGALGNGVSLREAVRDVEASGTIVFDRAVFNSLSTNTITLTKGPLNPQRNCTLNGALNPGGIKIVQVPTITAQPQPQSVASNAAANFAITVMNLSGGVAYAWRKNGTPNGTTAAALNFANAQEGDEGVYDVLLSEAAAPGTLTLTSVVLGAFSATSQPASLIVDGSAVSIKRHPANAMIALGSSHTLSVVAAGPGTLTYQWTLNDKNISGATKASYLIAKAALNQAGAYRCVVKSGATTATSDPAEIGVVDTTPKTVNLFASPTASFSATVNAAGNGITYVWLKNGGDSAFNAKSFVIKPAAAEHAGLYTCTVTGLAGTFTGGAPTRLTVSNAAPQIVKPLSLPPAVIGQAYFYQIPIANVVGAPATSFTVGGLPPGMTWDKLTGIISGRPTASTKPLGYPLTIKASNPKSSASATATLLVNIVPASAVGVFAGPLERSPLNDNLGGRFDLTTTADGLCSGSITLGARAKLSFTKQLLLSAGEGDVILRANLSGMTMADKTPLIAYFEVFTTVQRAVLTLLHPNGTTLLATAWRNPWSKTRPATAYAATYTARLDPANVGTAPRGYGFATLIVKTDGMQSLTGKLPDGSGVTQAGFVGPEGQLTLFNLLYAKRGSLVGPMQITSGSPVANNTLGATLSWFKPSPLPKSTDTVYQDGFGPLNVTVEGSPYAAPAKGQRVMGLGTSPNPNAKLDFTLGGLAPEFAQLLYISNPSATGLTNKGTLTLPLTNASKLTKLDAAKGRFTGSFVINGATKALNRPALFEGLIVKIGATTQGYGFFLLPTVTAKISTSPKLSGRVVLSVP